MTGFSQRRKGVLKLVVSEYVATATPVGSETIVRKYDPGVSPATVRHEMASLEANGYIYHPHTSAGRVPLDKGYRYFVEQLMDEEGLSPAEQRTIRHQFHQVEMDMEQWTRLAAAVLANVARNAAVATLPKEPRSRLKHLELFLLQDVLVLLIVMLHGGVLKQQIVTFPASVEDRELEQIGNRFSAMFGGMSVAEIEAKVVDLTLNERAVKEHLLKVMQRVDAQSYEVVHFDGLGHLLGQPEFARLESTLELVEALQHGTIFAWIRPDVSEVTGVRVVIGSENRWPPLQNCALVITRYGEKSRLSGVLGVLGPTRMEYARTISSLRYLSNLMGDLLMARYEQ